MTSEDVVAALRLRWLSAVNLVALGLALAGLFTVFAPAQYRSEVTLYAVAVNRQITSSDLYDSSRLAQDRLPVYEQLVKTPQVLDPAVTGLGLSVSSSDLARRITVGHEDNTAVLRITVTDARAAGAKSLADAVATNLASAVRELEGRGQQPGAVELRVLSEGTFPPLPATPRRPLNLLVGFGAGLLAAAAVLALTAVSLYLRRRHTGSRWAYLELDGQVKLALVHLVDPPGAAADDVGTVDLVVDPLPGTAPDVAGRTGSVTSDPAQARP